jgi:GNAT superfamily N-acetyltransferase
LSPVVQVVRTHLELRTPAQLRPARIDDPRIRFVEHAAMRADHYRRLYSAVGERWHWRDRNAWSDEQLTAHLAAANVTVWECLVGHEPAGFFELDKRDDGSVEIAYFGLVAAFIGQGLGKTMLTRAAEEAWALGPTRVWLHTCTLDSPHALANYRARGFSEVLTETYTIELPEPWQVVEKPETS